VTLVTAGGTDTKLHKEKTMYSFDSDNLAGALPEVMEAVVAANRGHQMSYGRDLYTERLQEVLRTHFGDRTEGFPVFNGTGANVIALQSMVPRWGAVICASGAHINTDECGAPERVAGIKLLGVDTPDGKLTPELIDQKMHGIDDEHVAQPCVVSITQSTEVGTLYSVEEIRAICAHAHHSGLSVHMDGARLSNAAASLGLSFREITTQLGVDVISFGGTKAGLLFGEVIVVANPDASVGIRYIRKFNMQLASKMRFISAQFVTLLEDDLWRGPATHANSMAKLLGERLMALPGVVVTQPTQANAVFAILPESVDEELRQYAVFQTWNARTSEVRLMCSHDTTIEDVNGLTDRLSQILATREARG
jgi:threonine aldolase